MPFFSVIITTFNRATLLERALNSVFGQDYKDHEVIVINDGSQKDVERYHQILQRFKDRKSFKYIYQENAGVSAARNRGIREASGRFICFLDDDDYYLPNHLSCLHSLIKEHEFIPALYRTFSRFEDIPSKFTEQPLVLCHDQHPVAHVLNNLLTTNNVCLECSVLETRQFDTNIRIGEDLEMWTRLLSEYPLLENPVYTTVYDRTRDSASAFSVKTTVEFLHTIKKIFSDKKVRRAVSRARRIRFYEDNLTWALNDLLKNSKRVDSLKLLTYWVGEVTLIFYVKSLMKVFVHKAKRILSFKR